MNYGELIDPGYIPERDSIYQSFAQYYNNPMLTKVRDVSQYSIYKTKIKSMLGVKNKYILVFVLKNNSVIGSQEMMSNLRWECFQTRMLTEYIPNLKEYQYQPRRFAPLMEKIHQIKKDDQQTVYKAETSPLIITLLPNTSSPGSVYQPTGTIVTALETWQTIVSFY